jgi:hypothetical protein
MTFDIQIIHWKTLDEFVTYLAALPRPEWVKGMCDHNTYIPNERQWQGLASMWSMAKTYVSRGWSAGPHLYLAAEAPKIEDTGIWQMTPLSHVGVHAGPCNSTRIGIESVGDFQARPPSVAQWSLCVAVNAAICHAWRLPPPSVLVHKECMTDRTCPGQYFSADRLRADVAKALTGPTSGAYRAAGVPVYYDSLLTRPTGAHLDPTAVYAIDATAADNPTKYHPRAGHVSDTQGGGFVNMDGLERV